jgi:DNA helicase-2/ATP-dependent DNA helicase PcrA
VEAWPAAREAIPAGARASGDALVNALIAARAERRPGPRAEGLRDALAPLVRER